MQIKHFFITIACMWMFSDPLSAQESKEINLSFDSANFGIEYNNKSEGIITFKNADFSYDENQTLPCIPYTTVNVAIPSCCQFQSFDFNADFSVFKKDLKSATIIQYTIKGRFMSR